MTLEQKSLRSLLCSILFISLIFVSSVSHGEEYQTVVSVHGSTISIPVSMGKGELNPRNGKVETHIFYSSSNPFLIIFSFGETDSISPVLKSRDTMLENAPLYQNQYDKFLQKYPDGLPYNWEKPIVLKVGENDILRLRAEIPKTKGQTSNINRIMDRYFWVYPEYTYYIHFSYPKDRQSELEPVITHIINNFKIPDQRQSQ